MGLFTRRGRTAAADDFTPDLSAEPAVAQSAEPGDLAMTCAYRNLITTRSATWAYFTLGDVDWQNQTPSQRGRIMSAWSHRIAQLAGHRIWLRGTTAPVNYRAWADRLDREHPHPDAERVPGRPVSSVRLRDVTGEHSFGDLVEDGMNHLVALDARRSAVVLGVRIIDR